MNLDTTGDEHTLTNPPLATAFFSVNVWMSVPAR